MNRCVLWIFISVAAFLAAPSLSMGSFEAVGIGARPSVLGSAYTAAANDIYAITQNPAGLVYLKRKEFTATYGLIHPGLDDGSKIYNSFVAYAHPISPDRGSLGLSYYQMNLNGLYHERSVAMGYAKRVRQRWAFGANIKQLSRSFGVPQGQTSNSGVTDPAKTDPAFSDGDSAWNIGFDLGAIYRPAYNYSYGFSIENINEPNLAVASKNSDPVPMTIRGGMAYSDGSLALLTALDSRKSSSGIDRDIHFTAAGEKWWLGSAFANGDLSARGSLVFGSRSYSRLAFGFSFRLESVQMDYGFLMPLHGASLGTTQGTHQLTMTLRFGKVIIEPDYELRMRQAELDLQKTERELELIQAEKVQLLDELKQSRDETEKKAKRNEAFQIPIDLKALALRFAELMDKYWKRKSAGASNEERIALLRPILSEFRNKDFDVSVAENELAALERDKNRSDEDLAVSWNYYQKIAARGASVPERILLLNTMIERFSKTGADIARVRDELNSLKSR